ncbi:MAG: ABC transporter substrate-binding protein [Candidatus Acidiferrales bacterium]
MRHRAEVFFRWVTLLLVILGCSCARPSQGETGKVNFLIESAPVSLDPRIGTDAQSAQIDALLFDGLLDRDANLNLVPDLAEKWEMSGDRTYIFHLRRGVKFHDGRPLTSADVKYTYDSVLSGTVATGKRGSFRLVDSVTAPDDWTVVFHLREPYASFPWNLVRAAMGIVPRDSGKDLSIHPIGTGPFRFVSARQDEEVVLERNADYFEAPPSVERLDIRIVPDALTRALELRKGSADAELNSLTPDMVFSFQHASDIHVSEESGTMLAYVAFNFDIPILAKLEVRQALACATDRATLIRYLERGQARVADSLLPPNHWAYEPAVERYEYDPARADKLLDAAGYPRGPDGVRFHLTLNTSTDESTRLLAAALQDEWRRVGVALEVRSLEFATFYSDISHGSFELYTLRWVGANLDPDIFEFVFGSRKFPPEGANRGHYRNAALDALLAAGRVETNLEKRRAIFSQVQKIVAQDLPYLNLWYLHNVSVHRSRLRNVQISPAGGYDFLRGITLQPDPR